MSLTLLISSWRVRGFLYLLSHRFEWTLVPLAGVGARAVCGWSTPAWGLTVTAVVSVLLIVSGLAGARLHRELDTAGLPCRWCDVDVEEEAL